MLARPSGQNHAPRPRATAGGTGAALAPLDAGLDAPLAPGPEAALRPGDVVNLPNIITFARLCAVPLAIWLVLRHQFGWTVAVFAAAGVSDGVDGYLARRRGGTVLGATLDPLADKALLVGMFVTLAAMGVLPDWLAILVVFRDLVILGGVAVLWGTGHRVRIRPLLVSKLNTAAQIVLVGVALALAALGRPEPLLMDVLVWAVAVTTLGSGAAYVGHVARPS